MDPNLSLPFEQGWIREVVRRSNSAMIDIYYRSPAGKRYRSLKEILGSKEFDGLSATNFSFERKALGIEEPSKEVIVQSKRTSSTKIRQPLKKKRAPSPSTKKESKPEKSTPVKSLSNEIKTKGKKKASTSRNPVSTNNSSNNWTREVVHRTTGNKIDIYYRSPEGKRYRSAKDITRAHLSLENLSFEKKALGENAGMKEVVLHAQSSKKKSPAAAPKSKSSKASASGSKSKGKNRESRAPSTERKSPIPSTSSSSEPLYNGVKRERGNRCSFEKAEIGKSKISPGLPGVSSPSKTISSNQNLRKEDTDHLMSGRSSPTTTVSKPPSGTRLSKKNQSAARIYVCFHCSFCTKSKFDLRLHIKEHIEELGVFPYVIHKIVEHFECYHCGFECSKKPIIRAHMFCHTRRKAKHSCEICGYRTNHLSRIKSHNLVHTILKPFECYHCHYRTKNYYVLKKHIESHLGIKNLGCEHCEYRTNSKWALKQHELIHQSTEIHKCQHCDFTSSRLQNVKNHLFTHSGKRPFLCKECGYRSKRKKDLRIHMYIHTNYKPYQCPFCDYRCSIPKYLKLHIRIHTGEKPYSCSTCDFKTAHRSALRKHVLGHTGKLPFGCPYCPYRTQYRTNQKHHIMVHQNKRPFVCSQCLYTGRSLTALKLHMRVHEKVRLHTCNYCFTSFKYSSSLARHRESCVIENGTKVSLDLSPESVMCNFVDYSRFIGIDYDIYGDAAFALDNLSNSCTDLTNGEGHLENVTDESISETSILETEGIDDAADGVNTSIIQSTQTCSSETVFQQKQVYTLFDGNDEIGDIRA